MTVCGVGACGTGVGFVESKSMGPTIKHGNAIIGRDCMHGSRGHWRYKRNGFWCWFSMRVGCHVGAVVPTSAGGDGFVEAFLVFGCEEFVKLNVGFVGGWAEAPHVAGQSEDASGLEQDGG